MVSSRCVITTRGFFWFQGAMNVKQVKEVEDICNDVRRQNKPVYAKDAPLAQAKAIQGLRAVFDEVNRAQSNCKLLLYIGFVLQYVIECM